MLINAISRNGELLLEKCKVWIIYKTFGVFYPVTIRFNVKTQQRFSHNDIERHELHWSYIFYIFYISRYCGCAETSIFKMYLSY